MPRSRPRRRLVAGVLTGVVVLSLIGCGDDGGDAATGSRDAFCAELRTVVAEDLTVFDPLDPVAPDETAAALDRLTTAAPEVVADDLALLADDFDAISEVLAEVEPSDPTAADQLEALDLDLTAIAAAQLSVARYALQACAIDLAAVNAASVTTVPPTVSTLPPLTAPATTVAPTTVPGTTAPPVTTP